MIDTIETLRARIAELEVSDARNERRWRNEEAAKHQVMGCRDEWRDRAEAAEARLAEIGAPAEGVDPLEVLRLDREPWHKRVGKRRSGPWTTALALDTSEEDGLDPEQVLLVGRLVAENLRGLDADQILADRAAAPALARALIAARADLDDMEGERDAARNAEEQAVKVANAASGAMMQAEGERDSARARADLIMLESVKATREVCAAANRAIEERDAARAEAEELRLTLAAEQGKAEGAPSEGWCNVGASMGTTYWQKATIAGVWAVTPTSGGERLTVAGGMHRRAVLIGADGLRGTVYAMTDRAAMLAADKAQG